MARVGSSDYPPVKVPITTSESTAIWVHKLTFSADITRAHRVSNRRNMEPTNFPLSGRKKSYEILYEGKQLPVEIVR